MESNSTEKDIKEKERGTKVKGVGVGQYRREYRR